MSQSQNQNNSPYNLEEQQEVKTYYAVDESGDPTFYNKKGKLIVGEGGSSPILIMGYISTTNPKEIRKIVENAKQEVLNDPLIFPLMRKHRQENFYFHAKEDSPDIKRIFFQAIKKMDIKARFVVARKIESVFVKRHLKSEGVFYDDLVTKLFKNVLYKSMENVIYFSKRRNKTRQKPMEDAIATAINLFEQDHGIPVNKDSVEIFIQQPTDEALLQVVDYMNWAVQRAFTVPAEQGGDAYLKFIQEKIRLIWDVYDFTKHDGQGSNFYNPKTNPFEAKKISPLGLGSGE
jgi:hypothetical protein